MAKSPRLLRITIGLFYLIAPTAGAAQVANACGGTDTLLMHCTFDNGAKQMALCQSGDSVSYAFGRDLGRPELSLSSTIDELTGVPFNRVSGSYFEQIRFYNGDTRYEVSSILGSSSPDMTGQINVRLPGGDGRVLTCDNGSVTPNGLSDGIGQIPSIATADAEERLSNCVDANSDALSCLGTVQAIDIRDHDCRPGQDWTDCWAHESKVWNVVLRNKEASAIIEATQMGADGLATKLSNAQDIWRESRRLDCNLDGGLLFAADGGLARCISESSAERINFLASALAAAEFDG